MKTSIAIVSILILASCQKLTKQNACNQVNPEDLKIMHHIIERSQPDTVKKYINYFINKLELPSTAIGIPDGEYYGETPYDDYEYKHVIRIIIENNKFTEVEYDEIKIGNQSKRYDVDYCKKMKNNIEGSSPDISYASYEKQLLDKQNLNEIDAVSGATYSLYRFKLAVIYAITDK